MPQRIVISGGYVYDHGGDTDHPVVADVTIEGDRIAAVGTAVPQPGDRTIDARGRLVMPGFVSASEPSAVGEAGVPRPRVFADFADFAPFAPPAARARNSVDE